MKETCFQKSCAAIVLVLGLVSSLAAQPPVTATGAEKADALYAAKDWAGAAAAYQVIAAQEPSNGRVWYRLGFARHSLGKYREAIEAYEKSVVIAGNPTVKYNLACAYARVGGKDQAFRLLTELGTAGFSTPAQLQADPDLESLRSDPRFQAVISSAAKATAPCKSSPESRQFDFWIGEWDVENTNGKQPVGKSSIQLILGDCVIFENWTGGNGGNGESFNAYNQETRAWQQNWMDDRGGVINFVDGTFKAGSMRFMADKVDANGKKSKRRLTFFNIDPKHVRQFSEKSDDAGKTWSVEYDFTYVRKP